MVDALADIRGFAPALLVLDVLQPPGIGSALRRSSFVDGAGTVAQEYAVGRRRVVYENALAVDHTRIAADEASRGYVEEGSETLDVRLGNPN